MSTIITIDDNFNLAQIKNSGQAFRISKLDNDYYRFIYLDHLLLIRQLTNNTYEVSCTTSEWNSIWINYFDLSTNYNKLLDNINIENDFLKQAYQFGNGIRILKQDPFEMYISYIISQQNNIPRITKIINTLSSKYGTCIYDDCCSFPTYEQLKNVTELEFKNLGLGYRARYVKSFIDNYTNDIYDYQNKSNEELYKFAKSFLGVGDKVASCIMLFAYHKLSYVPKDVWINRIISDYFNGVDLFSEYSDVAGLLQQYAYYYVRNK